MRRAVPIFWVRASISLGLTAGERADHGAAHPECTVHASITARRVAEL